MDHNEQEKRLRRKVCVFVALETLLLCLAAVLATYENTLMRLYYHEYTPFESVSVLMLFCAVPVVCTILSMRFKVCYCIYEILHALLGMMMGGVLFALVFSARFLIYLSRLRKIREE